MITLKGLRASVAAAALALSPSFALAGGFDLTGQPIDIIFEEGTYVEGRIGFVSADVNGSVDPVIAPGPTTVFPASRNNDIAEDLSFINGGIKADFTDRLSAALIYDTPFYRQTSYNGGLYNGTSADVRADSLTLVGRAKLTDNFSIHAGPRLQFASIDLTGNVAISATTPYDIDVSESGLGFVVGGAFEIPKYKVRAAVTYNSEIDHDFDGVETFGPGAPAFLNGSSSFTTTTPQSVNVDLQAPVTTSTLVKANVRWVNWEGINFSPPRFALANSGRSVVEYDHDTIRYRLTVAQRFTPLVSGFVTGSYEKAEGESISLFKTTDGIMSVGGGLVLNINEGLTVTLGGEYFEFEGLSGQQVPTPGIPSTSFEDSNGFSLGMKVGYRF